MVFLFPFCQPSISFFHAGRFPAFSSFSVFHVFFPHPRNFEVGYAPLAGTRRDHFRPLFSFIFCFGFDFFLIFLGFYKGEDLVVFFLFSTPP